MKNSYVMKTEKILAITALILILAGAVFLRANELDWETYGFGEIEKKDAVEANRISFVNYYLFDNPVFGEILFLLPLLFTSASEIAFRSVAFVFGILTVISVFILSRKLYGIKTALLASPITAFSILQIQFSRYAEWEIVLGFIFIWIAYFLLDAANGKKRSFAFLGAAIGIALSVKFTSIIIIASILAYAIYKRHIKASIKPNFRLEIDNWLLKSLIVAVVVFVLLWTPFGGFARLHTEVNISVDYGNEVRSQQIEADIPVILLSFTRRIFTSVGDSTTGILSVPILNYILLYITHESLLMLPLLAAGIYFMIKKPAKPDVLILIFIITFFVLLSFQRTSISYRHVVPIVPFIAIAASRWIAHVKRQHFFIGIVAILLFIQAWIAAPSYALYFNPLKEPFGVPDSEMRYNEGMKEAIEFLEAGCASTYASHYYRIMAEPYYQKIYSTPPASEDVCVVKGSVNDKFDVDPYIKNNNCTLAKTVNKKNVKLIEIYKC